jgi:hypothetical protein
VEHLSGKPIELAPGLARGVGIPEGQEMQLSHTELVLAPRGGDPGREEIWQGPRGGDPSSVWFHSGHAEMRPSTA